MTKIEDYFRIEYGGKVKDLDCKPEEQEMFGILCSLFADIGRDPEELVFQRYSNDYVTAKLGEWDLARLHWGKRAKWILFPTIEISSTKHRIQAPEEIREFSDLIRKSVEHIEKYS